MTNIKPLRNLAGYGDLWLAALCALAIDGEVPYAEHQDLTAAQWEILASLNPGDAERLALEYTA